MKNVTPDLIGTGGGFGQRPGISVQEVEEAYARCLANPSMRSVNAVLRICREQLMARGDLGIYPLAAGGFLVVFIGAAVYRLFFETGDNHNQTNLWLGVLAFVDGALWSGVFGIRHARKAAFAQEAAILELTAETLEFLLRHDFPLAPLEREKVDVLRRVLKQHHSPALQALLDFRGD